MAWRYNEIEACDDTKVSKQKKHQEREYRIDTSKEMGQTVSGDMSRKLNKEENLAVVSSQGLSVPDLLAGLMD